MPLGTKVGLGLRDIVLDGDPALPPLKGHSPPPIFGPYLLQPNVAWIEMSIGMEVGGPGDFVLDGDPAPPPQKGAEPPPQFFAHVYWGQTAAWIKMHWVRR